MTYKHIKTAREARLWIAQIIIPGAAMARLILGDPGIRDFLVKIIKNDNGAKNT